MQGIPRRAAGTAADPIATATVLAARRQVRWRGLDGANGLLQHATQRGALLPTGRAVLAVPDELQARVGLLARR